MKKILFISLILSAFVACKKKEEEATPVATISIATPTENQIFNAGDTLHVTGTVSADGEMHGYSVKIQNLKSGEIVLNQDYDIHQASFVLNESWINTVADTTQVKITVDAVLDHEGNLKSLDRIVTCYP